MAAEDDFVLPVRKSGRKKKPSVKQRLLDDSGDSDDDFVSVSKRSKPHSESRVKDVPKQPKTSPVNIPPVASNQKPKRLSRDEKMFNRALEQALVVSTAASPGVSQEPSNGSQLEQDPPPTSEPSDTSDYAPDQQLSESDVDFEPSPSPPRKKEPKKPKRKETTQSASKKENVKSASGRITKAAPITQKLSTGVTTVKSADLPGAKPRSSAVTSKPSPAADAGSRRQARPKWVPPGQVSKGAAATGSVVTGSPHTRTTNTGGIRLGLSRRARIKPLHQTPLRTKN